MKRKASFPAKVWIHWEELSQNDEDYLCVSVSEEDAAEAIGHNGAVAIYRLERVGKARREKGKVV